MLTSQAPRRETHAVNVGGVIVGGGAPIVVQSMTNTDTADAEGTARQVAAEEEQEQAQGERRVADVPPPQDKTRDLATLKSNQEILNRVERREAGNPFAFFEKIFR